MKKSVFDSLSRTALAVFAGVAVVVGFLAFAFNGNIAGLVAAVSSALSGAPVVVFFTPYQSGAPLSVGETETIDLDINAGVPVNAVGATITFPDDMLDVVDISKERSFLDLWTQNTTLQEQDGQLIFSGGTTQPGGAAGTSTVITITVRAKKSGEATLALSGVQVFAADGKGTTLQNDDRSLTLDIAGTSTVASTGTNTAPAAGGSAPAAVPAPTPPSADFNGDGQINLVDVSILIVHMVMPYNPRYDLNMDGKIDLSDLSVLFSKMGGH